MIYTTNVVASSMASVKLDGKSRALVRQVPQSFTDALAKFFGSGSQDIELAQSQHHNYVKALEDAGVEVTVMEADNAHPDCVFVEDQAVVIDGHVLLPVPGHVTRRGEQPPIAEFLINQLKGHKLCRMELPAKMDGGDIIRIRDKFYVGHSTRTNSEGIEELKQLLDHLGHELSIINIPDHALHLTSVSSTPSDNLILASEGHLPKDAFEPLPEGVKVLWAPEEEVYGCNTIGFPSGDVLIPIGHPTVKSLLEGEGLNVIELDVSELRNADGSLTCCSIFY